MSMKGPRRGATSPPVVHRLPLTQARVNLGAVVKRARLHKEYFVLEKDGIPVAGLMDIDAFEDHLELQDPKVRAIIAEGRRRIVLARADLPGTFSGPFRRAREASPRGAGRL